LGAVLVQPSQTLRVTGCDRGNARHNHVAHPFTSGSDEFGFSVCFAYGGAQALNGLTKQNKWGIVTGLDERAHQHANNFPGLEGVRCEL
jgi:hypothetical protein